MLEHTALRALSFTGSTEVGNLLYERRRAASCACSSKWAARTRRSCSPTPTPITPPRFCVNGAFFSTGQKCTACSRAIIERPIYEALVDKLIAKTRALKVGNGLEPGIDIGPAVDDSQLRDDLSYIDIARKEGATLLQGGNKLTGSWYDKGYFIEPTIFGGVTPDMRIAQEEVFGPVLALMVAEDFEDAIRLANAVKFGLSASIVSNNLSRVHQFVNRIEAGLITVNLPRPEWNTSSLSAARRNRASACASRDSSRSTSTRRVGRSISNTRSRPGASMSR